MPNSRLRILLVEDDELFRLGLQFRLQQESDIEIVAEAADGETAVELANRHPLDLVLLDVGLPRMSGLEACRQIKVSQPQLAILALTSHSEQSLITRLIEAGVNGYCLKGIAAEMLILAVRSVAAGASWWDRTATEEIRSTMINPGGERLQPQGISLTNREREILALIVAGKIDRDIAETLYIAPATVRVHVHAMLHKLGARDRSHAILIARQQQLCDPSI
ncbi:MAG: response regulator transcription factor [Chamaesiphon sp.]|nr:response regulator transcription factor [Chamaesiphon sp.]